MRMIFRCDPRLADHLPRPVPARSALPDWLRAMPANAHSEIHRREIRTVKQCPPFVDAMAYGVMILLPCDITVDHGAFSWDWDIPSPATEGHPRAPLSFHVAAQFAGAPFAQGEKAAIKFNSFWTIELEPGWSLFATHPGQSRRPAVPADLGTGRCRSLPRRRHQFSGGLDRTGFFRRVEKGHAGGAVLCGAARRIRSSCSRVLTMRTGRPIRKPSPRCSPRPTSIASVFARDAAKRKRLFEAPSRS